LTYRGHAQDINATLSGSVTDPGGAVIPGATLKLTNSETGFQSTFVSDAAGEYTFRNLTPGKYDLNVMAAGFKSFDRKGIELAVNQAARVPVQLAIGKADETVTVIGDASLINYENQTLEGGVSPEALQDFPLIVSGAPRSSVAVATMMPGVTSAGGNNAFNARINGGMVTGDEAIVDGVTTSEGYMNQSGMVALQTDFGMSPDITSEVKVLTADYDAQYGNTTSGQLIIQTKSGGEKFHGAGYEYNRNDYFNATPYGTVPGSKKPADKENDYGTNVGGPMWLPKLHGQDSKLKSYFYFNWEHFKDAGGSNPAPISIASNADRAGNFSAWGTQLWYPNDPVKYGALAGQQVDASGLGHNVIDPKFEDPIAKAYLAALPAPSTSGELNNYDIKNGGEGSLTASENVYFFRIDTNVGAKDHLYYTYWWQYSGENDASNLPKALSDASPAKPENAPIQRINWEHTFNANMTNHFSFGYLNRNEGYYALDGDSPLPHISGVSDPTQMPAMQFSQYANFGSTDPKNGSLDKTTRGTLGLSDVFTFVRGKHTFKAGYEWKQAGTAIHENNSTGGAFSFSQNTTGNLVTGDPGDDMASFYMGAVAAATTTFYNVGVEYPRQHGYAAHFGDEWRVSPRLTANLSVRWDYITPFYEKNNHLSFIDPIGTNPGAGNLAGRLAFAGDKWGPTASYGSRYPEQEWRKAVAPRIGFAYTLNEKTVLRAGYGIYYGQAFYPGWDGGMSQDGFNKTVHINETSNGVFETPGMYLANGMPTLPAGATATSIDPSYDNGTSPSKYRPLDGNKRPYSSQWNMTVERQLPSNFFLTASYVGTKGTHLPSDMSPLNVLNPDNPTVQALGSHLNDTFGAGQVSLDGVNQPYAGWASQMQACAPTVAQALVPYPQYCGVLQGQNEQHATSIYNSFQAKVERHMANGLYLLSTLTVQKLKTDASDTVQSTNTAGVGNQGNNGQFSPFNYKARGWGRAPDNVPATGQVSIVYDLPFGVGKRYFNGGGLQNTLAGGWQVTPLFHYDYGTPFSFYSSSCNINSSMREGCIPGTVPGQLVQLHGRNGFNPAHGGAYLNLKAFEPYTAFSTYGYTGTGSAVTSIYGPSYENLDMSLAKDTRLAGISHDEAVHFKFGANFFNIFNTHALIASQSGNYGGPSVAFHTDVANSNFGTWNGGTSNPRTVQFYGRLEF
jgi:hypothetical protein